MERSPHATNNLPSRIELISAWAKFYGSNPPKGISTRLLSLAYEYNIQAGQYGGLKKSSLRKLNGYITPSLGKRCPHSGKTKPKKPIVGTRLVREWRGQSYVIDVQQSGVLYQGQEYKSLSEVARAITGARWSGPRFFGL